MKHKRDGWIVSISSITPVGLFTFAFATSNLWAIVRIAVHQQNLIYGHRAHSGTTALHSCLLVLVEMYRLLTLLPSAAGYAL